MSAGAAGVGPVLDVAGLRVSVGGVVLVDGVDLRVEPGELVALVGPSGSGKSVTARAALGLSAPGVGVHADRLLVAGHDVRTASERAWRRIRGASVGYVGQEALGALDPLRPVGREVGDALRLHTSLTARERVDRVRAALEAVGLDPAMATDGRLAGSLSGGMRQRALIAAATVASPELLIADEPTTALDAAVAVSVMRSLRAAQERGAGVLVITHDAGLVAGWADRVVRLENGRVARSGAEAGCPEPVVPPNRDTRTRLGTHPDVPNRSVRVPSRAPVLAADGIVATPGGHRAVDGVDLTLVRGRTLGVVGASGSGKTTLVRVLLGLETPTAGTVTLDGEPWAPLAERDRRARRHRMSVVVQDPGATFDERWTVERVLVDALTSGDARRVGNDTALGDRVDAALRQVELDPAMRPRSPRTLSGGQRQRLAIARALATDPEVLLLDEPVTALDAVVQDAVLTLLERLRDTTGVAMVMVSHDLEAVGRLADDLVVMHEGRVVERGPTGSVFGRPTHAVTAGLLDAAEALRAGVR